jgi:hypothetical protein
MHRDMRMTFVFWRWVNSPTRYQDSYRWPLVPLKSGAAKSVNPDKIGPWPSRGESLRASLNPDSSGGP